MMFGIFVTLVGMALPMGLAAPPQVDGYRTSAYSLTNQDTPVPTAAAAVNPEAFYQGEYVVTLVNSHTTDISTVHGQNIGSPTAINDGGSILEAGATAIFAIPTGWAGRVAMAEANIPILDRASLLEGSFMIQYGTEAQIALDVSYVDGFTVPIVCECGGQVRLGCNLNLLDQCPDEYRINAGTCINPSRDSDELKGVFFKPCSSLAYTFPEDDLATINGITGCERAIECCVGTACAPHPSQQLCADASGVAQPCR
ncbi:hypothetical protein GGS21DRAFT_222447 [Xylaria nigripes]|nr:hypothetical protein GGS21DRAFT_222447 [Xylaria nigripes]